MTMTHDDRNFGAARNEQRMIATPSRAALWAGRVLSGLGLVFMTVDAGMKLLKLAPAVQGTVSLGYPESLVLPLGVVQLLCLVLYLVPRSAVLGRRALEGVLGRRDCHSRSSANSLFSHVLFPVYVAILFWAGLYLRRPQLRALLKP